MRATCALSGVTALVLSACSAPSQPKAMIAVPEGELHHSKDTVSVVVSGGKATSSTGASQISDQDFAQALRESIEKAGLFVKAMDAPGGDYRLEAYIGQLSQPVLGFDMTVAMEVGYVLTDTRSKKAVWKKSIATTYTATTKDALVGATRLQMANEGAARLNIRQAITEMSKLDLE